MASIGFNSALPAAGCGMSPPATALPRPAIFGGGGFELPGFDDVPQPDPFGGERFIASEAGGFVLDKDGELAGRVPEGSYVDTKTGKVYGPDDKAITVPEGGTVDFRDLPDLDDILKMVKAAADDAGEIHGDRFISSEAGGIIIGKDGDVAGRVPAGSFVDAKSGKVYGPDSKPITLPEGATVDFFDLPDLDDLLKQVRGGGAMAAGAAYPAGKFDSMVDGQWGPGGVTSFKGGAHAAAAAGEDCGMDHGPTGSKAGGPGSNVAALDHQLQHGLAQLQNMGLELPDPRTMPMPGHPHYGPMGGGFGSAVNGARGLGSLPSLDSSLKELVITLRELTEALAKTTAGGPPAKTEPAKTESSPSTTSSSPSDSSSSSSSSS
jgi:hypothetical protein